MEDFKDVMLSEVPFHSRGGGYQPSNNVGAFENYKGILLCDRPSENKIVEGGPQPFLPPGAVEDNCMGLQPSNEQLRRHAEARRALANKKKVNTVQNHHRKALKALNDQKIREKMDAVEAAMEEETRRERFQAKQAKLRQAIINGSMQDDAQKVIASIAPGADPDDTMGMVKGSKNYEPKTSDWTCSNCGTMNSLSRQTCYACGASRPEAGGADEHLPPVPPPPVSYVRTPPPADGEPSSTRSNHKPTPRSNKPKKSAKPKWAMTEEEAMDAELKETDDLVKFAEGLDFEKYLDDYEIREALSIMRERVEELKDERGEDDAAGDSGDDVSLSSHGQGPRPGRRAALRKFKGELLDGDKNGQLERDWDNMSTFSALSDRKRRLISDEAMRLAEKILDANSGMKNVHSKQSLGRLLEDLTHKAYNEEKSKVRLKEPMDVGAPIPQPPIATHQAVQNKPTDPPRILTQLKKSQDYVQNLPYLYRCPSI
jgi:hypothetical protein|mmetsp:Transcript_72355/g.121438  ORF Transcript_72355/g.121438 Transcript_72355/m.121438 type:complete len:485 (-) Transcript_72355:439-1893(-)